ncbi:hypothetical protein BO94DRAFT_397160 [Aspergillus sclerotioniger CBS 115572]|uniref:Uncharacterized protein n=1 Tax=Aspergillus sclerotioniger CBS 115572 TaxID=1450535 RepID=A0A317WYT8_9EURO|nr:hypothetical protein BO94DRAFT_397160 [Aspergillus sclerotioniger CBS 115572]PWY91556.1 hypothetical protein BO94DRAFT_397160 [Aspergillus sclerotioniger CBS 115572]
MLTPIRVRGRRTQHPNDGAIKPRPSGPRGGRPFLSHQTKLDSSQARSHKRARLLVATPIKPRKSILESLPVELIEKIFLYSLNVNFARCSSTLTAAISSERIYRALILLAFWADSPTPAVTARASEAAISRILRPVDYVPISHAERRNLQDSILRCKWCTIPRLLAQLPDLMNLTIQRHWFGAGMTMSADKEGSLTRFLAQKQDIRIFEGTDPNANYYTLSIKPLVSITVTHHETDQSTTHPILGVLLIPDKLFHGLYSPDKIRYLETLRIASGFNQPDLIKPTVSVSRESLQGGIHAALVQNNAEALATLLKIDEYYFRSEIQTLQPTAVPYTVPAEHFRTAVRVARHDTSLFQLLIRASAESVPADDPEITGWAVELDDAFGAWVLELMLQLPQQIEAAHANPAEDALFYLGRANGQRELGRRYLREVLGSGSWDVGWQRRCLMCRSCGG